MKKLHLKKKECGHSVRLAYFKEFVLTAGLEFYPLGGDPKVLAGWLPGEKQGLLAFGTLRDTHPDFQRNQIKEIFLSLLPACKDPDPETQVPFTADAIIANPRAYGHADTAEALKIPVHIFFTMPWMPTSEFPHPLSRVRQPVAYRLSYQVVDALTWLGIRDLINEFRMKERKLRHISNLSASYSSPLSTLWISLEPSSCSQAQRTEGLCVLLDNVPNDWLFLRCGAVVHHGGAGSSRDHCCWS